MRPPMTAEEARRAAARFARTSVAPAPGVPVRARFVARYPGATPEQILEIRRQRERQNDIRKAEFKRQRVERRRAALYGPAVPVEGMPGVLALRFGPHPQNVRYLNATPQQVREIGLRAKRQASARLAARRRAARLAKYGPPTPVEGMPGVFAHRVGPNPWQVRYEGATFEQRQALAAAAERAKHRRLYARRKAAQAKGAKLQSR